MSFIYSNAQFAKYIIPVCNYFTLPNHDFNTHGKLTIMEQLRNISSLSTEIIKERFIQRENFLIKKLKTLAPYGLDQKLNQIHNVQFFCTA